MRTISRARIKAREVIDKFTLEGTGKLDVELMAAALGFEVDTVDFLGKRVQEITIGNHIAVRSTLGYRRRRWAIAHGIGHAIMHRHGNHVWLQTDERRSQYDTHEREAEDFAHELLIGSRPSSRFDSMGDTAEMSAFFGVPLDKVDSHPVGGFD